jgi:hypothetical protein
MRTILLRFWLSILAAGLLLGIEPKRRDVLLLQRKPASLLRLDLTAGKIRSAIALEKNADYAVAHPSEPFVYVLHKREQDAAVKSQNGYVTVVDLTKDAVIRYLPAGRGASGLPSPRMAGAPSCLRGASS